VTGSLALIVASGIGVAAGALVAQYVGERLLSYVTGVGFIAIGAWTLLRA
jgi:putative Ca2+/H+ antiporter (TMEM165/GDT1 family)